MENNNEKIIQVISLFRHGRRNCFLNFDTNEFFSADLCPESLNITINKGKKFIEKYFSHFTSPFNSKDFKCFISDTIRTIKTIIYRLSDLIPNSDFKSMNQNELKDFTIKNIPNAVYDDKIFMSYIYCCLISAKYCNKDPNYINLFKEVEAEISKKSKKALELYKKYLDNPVLKGKEYEYFKLSYIYDFLFYSSKEIQEQFNEEQLIIKNIFGELDVGKRMNDIDLNNKNVNLCFSHQLMYNIYEEIQKMKNNSEEQKKIILFSAHDLYLISLLNFLEVDKSKYKYDFDDEINFIIFKKKNDDKLYFRAEYNDEVLKINKDKQKECELDNILEKMKKEYLFCSYEDIKNFCEFRSEKEFFN